MEIAVFLETNLRSDYRSHSPALIPTPHKRVSTTR